MGPNSAEHTNSLYVVQGEVERLLTCFKRHSKNRQTDGDVKTTPIQGLLHLKELLQNVSELQQVNIASVLQPFLELCNADGIPGPVTARALSSLHKFLMYGLVESGATQRGVAASLVAISQAVNTTQFVGTSPTADEAVLYQILVVLRSLVVHKSGSLLTDEAICKIIETCFRMCFEQRLREVLRKAAESILMEIAFIIFSRLHLFAGDNRHPPKKLRIRIREPDKKGAKKTKSSAPKKVQPPPPHVQVVEQAEAKAEDRTDTGVCSDSDTKSLVSDTSDLSTDSQLTIVDAPSDCESQDSGRPHINSTNSDYVNQQGVVFTPAGEASFTRPSDGAELQPYGFSCALELFRVLVQLVEGSDRNQNPLEESLGLELLTIALETASDQISLFPAFVNLVRESLLFNLLQHLHSECKISTLREVLRLCLLIIESCRSHLKFQLELFFDRLFRMLVQENLHQMAPSFEHQEAVLECLLDLWRVPGFIDEIYVNLDCGLYTSNVFEDSTKLLSKNAFPVHGLFKANLLSLDVLLSIIDTIEQHCTSRTVNTTGAGHQSMYRQNRMTPSSHVPTHEELVRTKELKKLVRQAVDEFNKKPKKGIIFLVEKGLVASNTSFSEIGRFLKVNADIDKTLLGDFITTRHNDEILRGFVEQFDFAAARIDEALRVFLESFRLPGEAQLIDKIMNIFADKWHLANGEPFASADAAFTLAFAIIMLNTDQHNPNVKSTQLPMTIDQFKRNLRGTNGDQDFDPELLTEIYQGIRHNEIILPHEHQGMHKDRYQWKVNLQQADDESKARYTHVAAGAFDRDLFALTWGPTVAALSYVYDKTISKEEAVLHRTMTGFRKCALIAAHYNLHDVFDNLVISLCKFTSLSLATPDNPPESIACQLGVSEKATLATKTVFSLAHRHGDILREGWKNLLDVMHRLHFANLFPAELEEVEDFVSPGGRRSIAHQAKLTKHDGGLFAMFAGILAPSDTQPRLSPDEDKAIENARNCIKDCHIELLLQDTKFLPNGSLQELVKALISMIQDSSESPDDVFMLELLVRVVICNRDRIGALWQSVQQVLCSNVIRATNYSFFTERCIIALIRLAIRLLRREEVSQQVVECLHVLLLVQPHVRRHVVEHVVFGLHDLVQMNTTASSAQPLAWRVIFRLLQVYGCGTAVPTEFLRDVSTEFEQDAVVVQNAGVSPVPADLPNIGDGDNQYKISLSSTFPFHSPKSFFKAAETLSLLVRDNNNNITWTNAAEAIACLRWFVEASVAGARRFCRGGAQSTSGYESDDEQEQLVAHYQSVTLQLLDWLNSVHTRVLASAPRPLTPEVITQVWLTCWAPLLQATARLCCDHRRQVRSYALTYLQRALLFPDLHQLSPQQWESAFNMVLFPLLSFLLEEAPDEPEALEETRVRACAQILCKVFLQHLSSLNRLPTFTALWLTILDFIDKYLKLNFDLLSEAIAESLKNVLLVMQTSGVLAPDEPDNQLWKLTWDRIDSFLPNLRDELAVRDSQPTHLKIPADGQVAILPPQTTAASTSLTQPQSPSRPYTMSSPSQQQASSPSQPPVSSSTSPDPAPPVMASQPPQNPLYSASQPPTSQVTVQTAAPELAAQQQHAYMYAYNQVYAAAAAAQQQYQAGEITAEQYAAYGSETGQLAQMYAQYYQQQNAAASADSGYTPPPQMTATPPLNLAAPKPMRPTFVSEEPPVSQ